MDATFNWTSAEAQQHQRMLLPAVLRYLPAGGGDLLDLGCGNGWLSEQYRQAGFRVTGFDSAPSGIEVARAAFPNVRFETRDLYATLGGPYDCIVASEVIEHLFAPARMLAQIFDALKPGGSLILTTPYHGWLKNVVIAASGKFDRHADVAFEGGHIKFFSRASLTAMLAQAGFQRFRFAGVGRAPLLWRSMVIAAVKPAHAV